MTTILILGGTREARDLASLLARRMPRHEIITALAGRTREPVAPDGVLRVGGFGGAEGLAAWLAETGVKAVVDATHPFATRISAHAVLACQQLSVPRLILRRPAWRAGEGDRWTPFPHLTAAAAAVPAGARVLLAIGRQELSVFASLGDAWFLIRSVEPPDGRPPANHALIQARGPFTLEAEAELLAAHRIDLIVTKNSGGDDAKLAAARRLGLEALMVERPPDPPGPLAQTVDDAARWIEAVESP